MTCLRGRANPDQQTKLRLFADSAGFCQHPECQRGLFVEIDKTRLHIAEIAHIFSAADKGPRAKILLTAEERAAYENLILLCPVCHTIVDKAPDEHPDDLMVNWKSNHVARISAVFSVVNYTDRRSVRSAIEPALSENRLIFDEYGPHNKCRFDPESELAQVWRQKVLSRILPNNRKILLILDTNRCQLRDRELTTLEQFRQHIYDLEARHVGESVAVLGRRFPAGMNTILE